MGTNTECRPRNSRAGEANGKQAKFNTPIWVIQGEFIMASKNQTTLSAEPGKADLVIIREFEAPPELVFKAHTDPKLYIRWLGPRDTELTLEKFEPKPGGAYRYSTKGGDGNKYSFYGVYHEVTAPERIISTFEPEWLPEKGHVGLGTVVFEALPGGRTRVTNSEVYHSVADRDAAIQAGMMEGVTEGYERLDELLVKS